MTHLEIKQAKALLAAKGYQVAPGNGQGLLVSDPIHRCGHGESAAQLILDGFRQVKIRSLAEASRFVMARS